MITLPVIEYLIVVEPLSYLPCIREKNATNVKERGGEQICKPQCDDTFTVNIHSISYSLLYTGGFC